jgi:hypothetical protein
MKNPRCGVPQILQAAGPIVLSIRYLLMYRRLFQKERSGIKHNVALFLILWITSPPGKTIDLMSCAHEGLMPHSSAEGAVSVTLHPTYPNLLRSKILHLGLARFPSIRGLSTFVLGWNHRLVATSHLEVLLALRVDL